MPERAPRVNGGSGGRLHPAVPVNPCRASSRRPASGRPAPRAASARPSSARAAASRSTTSFLRAAEPVAAGALEQRRGPGAAAGLLRSRPARRTPPDPAASATPTTRLTVWRSSVAQRALYGSSPSMKSKRLRPGSIRPLDQVREQQAARRERRQLRLPGRQVVVVGVAVHEPEAARHRSTVHLQQRQVEQAALGVASAGLGVEAPAQPPTTRRSWPCAGRCQRRACSSASVGQRRPDLVRPLTVRNRTSPRSPSRRSRERRL